MKILAKVVAIEGIPNLYQMINHSKVDNHTG
jgi:hypothetical protein